MPVDSSDPRTEPERAAEPPTAKAASETASEAAAVGVAERVPASPLAPQPERARRLLRLRVLLKAMVAVAFVAVAFVFVSAFLSGDGEEDTLPGLRVAVGDMAVGETRQLTWAGRAVLVHRRSAAEIARLEGGALRRSLRDPESADSEQPESMRGPFRSSTPEWFVAIGLGTDYGCPVSYLPPEPTPFAGAPWPGGFADDCRGSRYDLAGRVYARQYADRNLVVPPHTLVDGTLVLGR